MTETTKTILEKYQVRKSRKQKSEFISFVQGKACEMGYPVTVEKGILGARNIVVGNPDCAKVIYTAHYDTCAVMPVPNFITPKNFVIYLLYQILIAIPMIAVVLPILLLSYNLCETNETLANILHISAYILLFLLVYLIMAGPANKHTANDNTSGVTTLLDTMAAMPPQLRDKAAFVFFDLEELGLIGSASFASKHKNVKNNTLTVNFDCVSDGDNILIVANGSADRYIYILSDCFKSREGVSCEVVTGLFYPSDQANFKYGVGVCALKKSKCFGILYMDRIHTSKDTVYLEENIAFLKDCAVLLADRL